MKNIIERIVGGAKIARYLPKAVSTRLAVAALAALAAGGAWAAASPKATVVWNGDFGTAVKTGYDGNTYTFTLNPGNTGDNLNTLSGGTDGNLVIGSGSTYGGQIAWNHDESQTYTSVIIKYSNFTAEDSKVLAAVSAKTTTGGNSGQIVDDCVGVLSASGSTLTGRYNDNSSTWPNNGNSVATSYASGYLLIVYGSGQAFQFYTSPDGATWNGGTASGLTFGTTYSCGVGLGGMSGSASGYGVSAGMTIEAVAIFRGYSVSTSDISTYSLLGYFSSSAYEKWYYAKDVFTWHSDNASEASIGSQNSKVTLFSPTAGADTTVNYTCGGNTGYSGSTFWHTFCYGKGSYYTPGCVLRVTSAHENRKIKADYDPLTLGGLIIESGANGVDFYNDTSSRQTILGAATGNKETWFGIYDNATISRSGYLKLSGTVNLEVSKGKTFTISVANSPTIVEALTATDGTSTSGGVLKMHGLGTLAVSTLTATGGATLDFSDVQEDADVVRSTTPFIQGNLTVDSNTKYVFPSSLAKNTAYMLCSGTLTAPASVICDITVGTTVKKNIPLTFSGNTVSYGDAVYAATVDGTTVTWDGDEPSSFDDIVVTFSGSGTVTGLSGSGTTINAGSSVTVDVTNFTSPTLLGAGTFRWTANYPTTVPTGDFSYEYVGTGVSTEIANVTANGYLKTSGNIALASFTLSSGATLEVESGMTMVQAKQRLALSGNITIDSGAIFSNLQTADGHYADAVNYDQQGMKIIVRGTLAMSNTRWSLRQKSYHEFKLYDGAQITGTGDGNGALDWIENCGGQLDTYGGTVTISANMKVRSGATTANWVASGATCKFTGSTWGDGGFSKSGAGTLSFEGTHTQTGGVSASDGTIALNNISMTSSTITLSSASASPTLKMIATDAATTVSATVNVPANTRGQLAFEGEGTFALSGPNRNNNIVWLGTNLAEGTLNLAGDVTINNGSRGGSYVFNKVAGSGTLTLSTWEGCYNSNDNGLTYTINTIDADSFAGAIALKNVAAPNRQDGNNDCTLKFAIGDIKKSSAVYGTAIVGLTTNITAGAHGVNSIDVDLSSTTFNNSPATFLYDGSTGVYLAEASYNGTPYKTLALAIAAMETAEGNPADVIVYNSAATIPSGYGLVMPTSGNMTLRRAGEIYYTSGYWSSTENSFAVVTANGAATSAAAGDTVVIDSTHATVSAAWVADTFPANVTSIRIAKDFTFHSGVSAAIFGGVTVAVNEGFTLTLNNSNSQNSITLGAVTLNGPGSVAVTDTIAVSGAVSGTAALAVNGTVNVASGGSIANAVTGSGTITYAAIPAVKPSSFTGWTGTVQLPAITSGAIIFNNYGTTGSTVYLTSMSSGAWIQADNTTIDPKLYLAGNMTLSVMSPKTYTFAEIDGPGALSFATSDNQPTAINITKVAEGYSGTISSTLETPVTIATLDRAAGTTVTPGSKVLSTSSGVQASALTVGGVATDIVPVFDTDGLYVKAASVTKNDATTYHNTVADALTAAGSDAATITLLAPTDNAITIAPGQTLVNGNLTTGGVAGPNGYEVVSNNGTYTLVDNTASTWTDASGDHSWANAQNWSTGFVPSRYTVVTFPAGDYRVNLRDSGDQVGAMTVNGNVTFRYATDDYSKWPYLEVYGNISGSGSIKIFRAGLQANCRTVNVSCDFIVDSPSNAYVSNRDSFITGNSWDNNGDKSGWSFTKSVTVIANAYFKVGEATRMPGGVTISCPFSIGADAAIKLTSSIAVDATAGTTTMNGNFGAYDTGTLTFGAVTVAETMNFPDTDKLAFAGVVTVNDNVALTLAASPTYTSASFVLAGTGSTLIDANGVASGKVSTTVANYCVKYTEATTTYSVEAIPSSAEIGEATFEYGVDFTNATVTVAVTETNASGVEYTLAIGGKNYTASAVGGTTVTFNNVEIPRGAAYGPVSYNITSTASSTTGATSGSAAVADVQAGWINENATTHGLASAGGAWTNAEAVTYSEGKATISDNRFAATTASTASRVVLEFNVCFSSTSEDDVSGEAQAAIKLGAVNDATTFMVLTTGNTWTPVSNAELPIDASATYDVVLAIDYGTSTYKVDVEGKSLTNSAGVASFSLATNKAAVQNIDFVGSGTLTSMKGDQVEGYMVVDKNGTRYATISDAIAAYTADPTIGPLTVLHDGTPLPGWSIVTQDGVRILKKLAKGFFFMAY